MAHPKLIIWWLIFLFNGFIISGDSNLRNCKRVWGMSNTINNIPMYSTGLYMCVETPDGSVLALPETVNPPEQVKTIVDTLKNSSNVSNYTKFLSNSSTPNFFNNTNKTFHFQNYTNHTNVSTNFSLYNLAPSPSISTTTPSATTTTPSATTTTPSATTTPSTIITTTPSSSIITTPSSILVTTPSSLITTTKNYVPAPSPTHINDIIDNNYPSRLFNETNKNQENRNNEKEVMNPLLPTVIALSSIVGICIMSGIGFYIHKSGCCKGKKCSKTVPETEAEKVHDLESGEKNENKNRNSWTVMTTTLKTRKKLKELQGYRNKKALKPKLKSPTKPQLQKQQAAAVQVKKYPNKPPGMGGVRHIETKRRDNKLIRSHMEEQASRIPGGMRNASLQRMLKRFPKSPRQQKIDSMDLNMSPNQQEWYKDQFAGELTSMVDKIPYTPPALPPNDPPPPPDLARKQLKDINRVVYGNKKNDNSPKMTIRELNPEEN
tara:strand:- start:85 stop:1557 length:1473 start_codon:yes stop_codon:yes gene_type:complete